MGRYSLVLTLLVLTGLARMVVQPPAARPLALPAVRLLTAGSGWQVEATEASRWGMVYRQWTLRKPGGQAAFLYLAATDSAKIVVRWSGELGYQGEGYLVQGRRTRALRLSTGSTARVSVVHIQRLHEQRVLACAVVSPDGIAAQGTDHLLRTGWEVLRGTAGPYYLVRVAVPAGVQNVSGEAIALRLLARVLPILQTHVSAAAR
jgi:hypothetical protein